MTNHFVPDHQKLLVLEQFNRLDQVFFLIILIEILDGLRKEAPIVQVKPQTSSNHINNKKAELTEIVKNM